MKRFASKHPGKGRNLEVDAGVEASVSDKKQNEPGLLDWLAQILLPPQPVPVPVRTRPDTRR